MSLSCDILGRPLPNQGPPHDVFQATSLCRCCCDVRQSAGRDSCVFDRSLYNTAIIGRLLLTWFPNPPAALATPLRSVPLLDITIYH